MTPPRVAFPLVPTELAAWLLAAFAPIALVIAAVSPQLWIIAPVAAVALIVLVVLDGLMAGGVEEWQVVVPPDTEVGQPTALDVHARFNRRIVSGPEAALEFDPRLAPGGRASFALVREPDTGAHSGSVETHPDRRGTAQVTRAWLRWSGPLGLGARQAKQVLEDTEVRIWPDLSPVRSKELQTFLRDAQTGLIARRLSGSGDIYQLSHAFRAGESGRHHAEEFLLCEWYRLGKTMEELAQEVLELMATCGGPAADSARWLRYEQSFLEHCEAHPLASSAELQAARAEAAKAHAAQEQAEAQHGVSLSPETIPVTSVFREPLAW